MVKGNIPIDGRLMCIIQSKKEVLRGVSLIRIEGKPLLRYQRILNVLYDHRKEICELVKNTSMDIPSSVPQKLLSPFNYGQKVYSIYQNFPHVPRGPSFHNKHQQPWWVYPWNNQFPDVPPSRKLNRRSTDYLKCQEPSPLLIQIVKNLPDRLLSVRLNKEKQSR